MTAPVTAVAAVAAVALVLAPAAQGAQWTLEGNLQMHAEADDNASLLPVSDGTTTRLVLQGGLKAARQTETTTTRLQGDLNLYSPTRDTGRSAGGNLSVQQSLNLPLGSFSGALAVQRDTALDTSRDAADLPLGRTQRTTESATAGWTHAFDPLWSAQTDASIARTGYDSSNSTADYGNRSLSAALNRQWDETRQFGLHLSRSDYTQAAAGSQSRSDALRLSGSQGLDERNQLSLGLGAYRSTNQRTLLSLACPLSQALCDAGLVAPVQVHGIASTRGGGSQYDLAWDGSLDERTTARVSAARTLSPSGLGVQRADTLAASLSRALGPNWQAGASWTDARNRNAIGSGGGSDGARPRLRTVELSSQWRLGERLTLAAVASQRRYTEPEGHVQARSTGISITLQYQTQTLMASR